MKLYTHILGIKVEEHKYLSHKKGIPLCKKKNKNNKLLKIEKL